MQGVGIIILVLLIVSIGVFSLFPIAQNRLGSETPIKIIGWIPYWDQENAFNSFVAHADMFYSIAVFWYTVTEDGSVSVYQHATEEQKIIDFAKEHNVKILATVANLVDITK